MARKVCQSVVLPRINTVDEYKFCGRFRRRTIISMVWCVPDKGWTSIQNKQKHRIPGHDIRPQHRDNNRNTGWRVSYIDPTINVCKYWFSRFQPPQVPHSSTTSVVVLSLNGPNVLCRAQSAISGEWGCCCCYPPLNVEHTKASYVISTCPAQVVVVVLLFCHPYTPTT